MVTFEEDKRKILKLMDLLGDLQADLVYTEGAGLWLYSENESGLRPLKEDAADITLTTETELKELSPQLQEIGFQEVLNRDTTRRFHYDDILVEIVHNKVISWIPTMVWMKKGLEDVQQIKKWGREFNIVSFPHYLANKLSTFSIRDVVGPRKSYDFTVVAFLLDKNPNWDVVVAAENEPSLKLFILNSFVEIKNNHRLQSALKDELESEKSEVEIEEILDKMDKLLF